MVHFSFINLLFNQAINRMYYFLNSEKKIKARLRHIGPIELRPALEPIFGLSQLCCHPDRIW
jgi:hypothetical protein